MAIAAGDGEFASDGLLVKGRVLQGLVGLGLSLALGDVAYRRVLEEVVAMTPSASIAS